jgi:hypothetical protein
MSVLAVPANSGYPIHTIRNENSTPSSQKNIGNEMSSKIAAFQQEQGKLITTNCQHIEDGNVHYYGIHKSKQMQKKDGSESLLLTRQCYQDLKSHVLQNMGLATDTKAIQVVGDSASFSKAGTELAKRFLESHLTEHNLVIYGYTGHTESDGTRCVNAALSDVICEKKMQNQVVGNLVGFHTPVALKQWGCSGPDLQHYVIVYGDDETCREKGTVFGDDVVTSDYFADCLFMLEGGAQSFRQACNALLLDQKITVLSGLRAPSKAFAKEIIKDGFNESEYTTPYFAAAQFLGEVANLIRENDGIISEVDLQSWYKNYFGRGKCYVGDPKRGDFDTKQQLLDSAWALFVQEKLYLRIKELVSFV